MRVPIRLPGKSKYRAVRSGGYASKREANRAAELELLQKIGKIGRLDKQVRYCILEKDEMGPDVVYVADFVYLDKERNKVIVEDAKGFKTPLYRLKKRLMWTVWKIAIQEV